MRRAAGLILTALMVCFVVAGCTEGGTEPSETASNIQTNLETESDTENETETETGIETETDSNTEANTESDTEADTESNIEPNTESDTESNTESEMESVTDSESESQSDASLPTMKKFLSTAIQPVGTTLYVYGGGWNLEDTGSGEETRTLGLSEKWEEFFLQQDASYDYHGDTYPVDGQNICHELGLDCSGFVGWTLYNTLESENGREGYVEKSTDLAYSLYERGWGDFVQDPVRTDLRPGDIISMKGHVWICLGVCRDDSVLLVHSTPSGSRQGAFGGGVSVSSIGGKDSVAGNLADRIMKETAPLWYERYEAADCSEGYLSCPEEATGLFRFSLAKEDTDSSAGCVLCDPDGLTGCSGEEIVNLLYGF